MTTLNDLMEARANLAELMLINRSAARTADTMREQVNHGMRVRDLCEQFYQEEARLWAHLPPSVKINNNWDLILDWCYEIAGEGNYLVYLPKGQPRVLCLRNPGHATYLKLTYG